MFNPSRDEVRQFFCTTWQKQQEGSLLTALETIAADWINEHPEYHDALADTELAATRDYSPEAGQSNPFLHLSMHLAISEQVSIDQPPGIRSAYEKLTQRLDSPHDAQHRIMECLGQTLWDAQRTGQPPDSEAYLLRISQQATR